MKKTRRKNKTRKLKGGTRWRSFFNFFTRNRDSIRETPKKNKGFSFRNFFSYPFRKSEPDVKSTTEDISSFPVNVLNKVVSPLEQASSELYSSESEESRRVAEESRRVSEEAGRVAEEAGRVAEETRRVAEETRRVAEEESGRVAEEEAEEEAEKARQVAEEAEEKAEGARQVAEEARQVAEEARRLAEEEEEEAEEARRLAEEARRLAEEEALQVAGIENCNNVIFKKIMFNQNNFAYSKSNEYKYDFYVATIVIENVEKIINKDVSDHIRTNFYDNSIVINDSKTINVLSNESQFITKSGEIGTFVKKGGVDECKYTLLIDGSEESFDLSELLLIKKKKIINLDGGKTKRKKGIKVSRKKK